VKVIDETFQKELLLQRQWLHYRDHETEEQLQVLYICVVEQLSNALGRVVEAA